MGLTIRCSILDTDKNILFSKTLRLLWGLYIHYSTDTVFLSWGQNSRILKLYTHLHLKRRLIVGGAISLLLLYKFMTRKGIPLPSRWPLMFVMETQCVFCEVQSMFFKARSLNCEKRLLHSSSLSVKSPVCPSIRPHGTTRLSLDGFSWNLIFEYFPKICVGNSSSTVLW